VRLQLWQQIAIMLAAAAGCVVNEPDRSPPRVSTTRTTSAEVVPNGDSRALDIHVSPEIASRCGTSALRGIAACLTRGELRDAKIVAVGRILEGEGAERRGEHALSRAERVRRYFIDHGVSASRVIASAGISGSIAGREPNRVDLELAP
jgi:hypothetical protein